MFFFIQNRLACFFGTHFFNVEYLSSQVIIILIYTELPKDVNCRPEMTYQGSNELTCFNLHFYLLVLLLVHA